MADLSVAHRAALAQVIDSVPDRTLRQLAIAVGAMRGERARTLQSMLAEAAVGRTRRARGLAAIAPMFRPRPDGVAATTFPSTVLSRLWKIAGGREPNLLPLLDEDDDREAARTAAVCARIYQAAATAARDQGDLIWPAGLDPAGREAGLAELAHCCDLGALIHRALPSLKAWTGRPTGDQVAELRLLVRDAAAIAPDGSQRFMAMLFAHLGDAALILRLVAHSSTATAREAFVCESELAPLIDRLLAALEVRVARIGRFRLGEPSAGLKDDLAWGVELLQEMDATMQLEPTSAWGKRTRDARDRMGKAVAGLLRQVEKTVTPALPMERVRTSGRMTRTVPKLDAAIEPGIRDSAGGALAFVGAVRTLAGAFGCEAQRKELVQILTGELAAYADKALDAINGGEAGTEAVALDVVAMTAGFLEQIDAVPEARAVRRRAAVAGGAPSGAKRASAA